MASIDSVKLPDGTEYSINEKLASFTNANLVEVDANGNLKDSGIAKSTIGDKQNKTLDTSVESQTTVEGALGALSSNKQPKTMSATVESQTTVEGALGALSSNKQPKTMSASVESQTTVEGALGALSSNKQPKTLATPITVDGVTETTTEGALGAINALAASNKTALASKQNSSITPITIEGTSRSTVETALAGLNTYANHENDAISAITNVYNAKNLLANYELVVVGNGITFVKNTDLSVTVNGTASDTNEAGLGYSSTIPIGDYILSGSSTNVSIYVIAYNGTTYVANLGGSTGGNNANITINYSGYDRVRFILSVSSGKVVSNETVYPMLRDSRIPDATYEPFSKTNLALTNDKAERTDLSDIIINGTTNNTGSTITTGTYFYLNGVFCRALADVANGATFTLNTNYKVINLNTADEWRNITAQCTWANTSDLYSYDVFDNGKMYAVHLIVRAASPFLTSWTSIVTLPKYLTSTYIQEVYGDGGSGIPDEAAHGRFVGESNYVKVYCPTGHYYNGYLLLPHY